MKSKTTVTQSKLQWLDDLDVPKYGKPEGFLTLIEIMETGRFGNVGECQTRAILSDHVKKGTIEVMEWIDKERGKRVKVYGPKGGAK